MSPSALSDRVGRVVVITGAAGGIGSALARRFAQEGARLALLDLEAPQEVAAELIAAGAQVQALACDVTDPAACLAAVDAIRARFGRIDVLVNNAGITHRSPFAATDQAVLRRVMDVNYFGAVHMTQAALVSLRDRRGQVVAISSVAGFAPLLGRAGYVASKHALEGFMSTLRAEVAADGINVLIVRPGFVESGLTHAALGGDGKRAATAQRAVGRRMPPRDAADAIVRATARRQRSLVLTGVGKASWWVSRLAPRLYEAVMRTTQRHELAPTG